ncbi:hypothetical protein COOONC_21417 [Cooperia oncophora]
MGATCEGIAFMMRHSSTKEMFARDILFGIQSIHKLLVSILKLLDRGNPARFDHISATDKISVTTTSEAVLSQDFEDFGGLDGFIFTLFNDLHNICHIYRSHTPPSDHYLGHLEKLTRALFRHPVLHRFAIVPFAALKMNWKLRIEIRENAVHVPLVNIHLLCNLNILNDFVWRVNW